MKAIDACQKYLHFALRNEKLLLWSAQMTNVVKVELTVVQMLHTTSGTEFHQISWECYSTMNCAVFVNVGEAILHHIFLNFFLKISLLYQNIFLTLAIWHTETGFADCIINLIPHFIKKQSPQQAIWEVFLCYNSTPKCNYIISNEFCTMQ